jgi:hypothetical protein
LVFCLATGQAAAGWWPENPPPEYVHAYTGPLEIRRIPLREIPSSCQNNKRAYACTWHMRNGTCLIYLPNNVPAKLEAALKAHELGHCNGWRHDPEVQASETEARAQHKRFYEFYNKLYPPGSGAPP